MPFNFCRIATLTSLEIVEYPVDQANEVVEGFFKNIFENLVRSVLLFAAIPSWRHEKSLTVGKS